MLHRAARLATIALLVVGALAAIALVAWSFHIRRSTLGPGAGHAGLRSGLELAARLNTEYLAGLGAAAVLALGLAFAAGLRRAWAYVASAIGAIGGIVTVWWGRSFIVALEDPHFVKRSPWVKAATLVATVATVYLAILAVVSVTAWLFARKTTSQA